ncbi:hypothetical protein KY328_00925 [Candidatus Woesearchaeota archaeon]|nr:hypothetical protein [Candidatus Woesearchaeota archaeon]MBW3021459.1 hypothetical protein [Candidatus Woesearchaeota archaeon]
MNLKGILYLRELGLPGPDHAVFFRNLSELDLEDLYRDSDKAALIVFDSTEPLLQLPGYEKDEHAYPILIPDFANILDEKLEKMLKKGVNREDVVFYAHHAYGDEDISYSGRISILEKGEPKRFLLIDAVDRLREANTDFDATFVLHGTLPHECRRASRSDEFIAKNGFAFPRSLQDKLVYDISRIPGSPNVDFEVYNDGRLFYHDMFMS